MELERLSWQTVTAPGRVVPELLYEMTTSDRRDTQRSCPQLARDVPSF